MSEMVQFLARHGYWLLICAVLGRQACLPIPANLILVAAGALARSGKLNLSRRYQPGSSDLSARRSGMVRSRPPVRETEHYTSCVVSPGIQRLAFTRRQALLPGVESEPYWCPSLSWDSMPSPLHWPERAVLT